MIDHQQDHVLFVKIVRPPRPQKPVKTVSNTEDMEKPVSQDFFKYLTKSETTYNWFGLRCSGRRFRGKWQTMRVRRFKVGCLVASAT